MNVRRIGIIGFFLGTVLFSPAYSETRAFSLLDGRTIEAEIVDYDGRQGAVTLKRVDGKRVPVKTDIFVEADQLYFKEWDAAKAFTSDSLFRISCDEEVLEKRKEEVYKDLRDTEGNVEEHLMKEIKYEDIAYNLNLRNGNKTALDNMRMEYRIYYEQSRESRDNPDATQYVLAGKTDLPALPGGGTAAVTTDAVTIYSDNINSIDWSDGSARVGGKGEVIGLRARLYITMGSGAEMTREITYPKTLSDKGFPWKSGTGRPPAAVGAAKKKKKS